MPGVNVRVESGGWRDTVLCDLLCKPQPLARNREKFDPIFVGSKRHGAVERAPCLGMTLLDPPLNLHNFSHRHLRPHGTEKVRQSFRKLGYQTVYPPDASSAPI
jgi:hypothetical protein